MTLASDTCPRCGKAFHCGIDDAAPCPCATVRLEAATRARLRERYVGCLCVACLCELQKEQAGAVTDRPACED